MYKAEGTLFGTEVLVEWDDEGDVAVFCGDLNVTPVLSQEQMDEVYSFIGLFGDDP